VYADLVSVEVVGSRVDGRRCTAAEHSSVDVEVAAGRRTSTDHRRRRRASILRRLTQLHLDPLPAPRRHARLLTAFLPALLLLLLLLLLLGLAADDEYRDGDGQSDHHEAGQNSGEHDQRRIGGVARFLGVRGGRRDLAGGRRDLGGGEDDV